MTSEQIPLRTNILFEALINDSEYKDAGMQGFLTVNERICINQERAYLLSVQEPVVSPLRPYSIPEELSKKIIKSFD